MSDLFINGRFVERSEARVGAFDAGLQHGVGLFETMLGIRGQREPEIVGLADHMERLRESASSLKLSEELRMDGLADAALETFRRSGLDRARIRLTVTGGDLNLLETSGESNHEPTVLIAAQPATAYPEEMYERGVLVTFADARANPFHATSGHKTLDYWWRLRELQGAASKGAGEAVVLQVSNHVAGGCVSNIMAVHGEALLTPIARGEEKPGGVPSPVLPGVTRLMALGWAEEMGLDVRRQMMTVDDLLDADELMLTNSSFGVLPVTRLEGATIKEGTPGRVSLEMGRRWRDLVG